MPAKRKRTTKGGKSRKRTTRVARAGKPVGSRSKGKTSFRRKSFKSHKRVSVRRGGQRRRLTTGGSKVRGWTLGGKISLTNLGSYRIAGTAGQQLWLPDTASSGSNDPDDVHATTVLLTPDELGAIWSLLPVQNVAAGTINALPAAANYQHTDRYYVHSAVVRNTMNNPTNAEMHVTAYYCVPRHDIPLSAAPWDTGSPTKVMAQSLTAGTVAGTNPSLVDLSVTPFQCQTFVKHFKIYKVQKVIIHPGMSKTFTLSRKRGFFVDMDRWGSKDSMVGALTWSPNYNYGKGMSKFIMYSVKGGIVNDVTPTQAEVSTAVPTIQGKVEIKYCISTIMGGVALSIPMVSTATGGNTGILPDPTADTVMTQGSNAAATFATA